MNVYFLKSNLKQYQIEPIPSNLADFVETEMDYSDLDRLQMIKYQGEFILVKKQPSELHIWNGKEWIIDSETLAKLKAEQQAQMWEKIKQRRYDNGLRGVYVARVDKWFQTGEEEKTKYLGLDKVIDKLGKIQWKTYDNSFVELDRTLLDEIFLQMVVTENADHINAEKHRMAMMSVENPLEYDYSSGWAEIYEEGK
ncbi:Uncharacterised protein [Canicola haemoglobinophilus]|uniref:DUF4376 domain-containing protein n=1 Tax=Canicola haemoglobinophilus TaxID=733 RepID=A0AB38HBA0_9PAST|nr:DUF4376 domain-containing protein [Canicola haemoglobinophilus]STO54375.1 Uncharacterised protein [Canicola haemoglobinophilus]STO68909.1 Uncharacterised protein [Canicola haemoglobinophilus]